MWNSIWARSNFKGTWCFPDLPTGKLREQKPRNGRPSTWFVWMVVAFLLLLQLPDAEAQKGVYFGTKTVVPQIPSKEKKIRVLIVSDATNEIDDIWAISLALLFPERFQIEGFVGSNYDHSSSGIGPNSIQASVEEIKVILKKAGMEGACPVLAGSHPMQYEFYPTASEGVNFIIQKAMESSPEDPLWIIGLGNATDMASAYLMEPRIADRIIVFWHARTHMDWPFRARNYNIKGDMHAARMMFHAPFPLVLFDTGTYLYAGSLQETEQFVKPYGDLGDYLYWYRMKHKDWSKPNRSFFDLGDIAVLIDPALGVWEESPCPTVTPYMEYDFYKANGKLLRCKDVDRDKTYQLLYQRLKMKYSQPELSDK